MSTDKKLVKADDKFKYKELSPVGHRLNMTSGLKKKISIFSYGFQASFICESKLWYEPDPCI